MFAHSEAEQADGSDFDFADTVYYSADYAIEVAPELELSFHIGHHDGDFSEAFNGVPGSYIDYNIALSKGPFAFMITDTDLDDAGDDGLSNDEPKFVVSYTMDIDL